MCELQGLVDRNGGVASVAFLFSVLSLYICVSCVVILVLIILTCLIPYICSPLLSLFLYSSGSCGRSHCWGGVFPDSEDVPPCIGLVDPVLASTRRCIRQLDVPHRFPTPASCIDPDRLLALDDWSSPERCCFGRLPPFHGTPLYVPQSHCVVGAVFR